MAAGLSLRCRQVLKFQVISSFGSRSLASNGGWAASLFPSGGSWQEVRGDQGRGKERFPGRSPAFCLGRAVQARGQWCSGGSFVSPGCRWLGSPQNSSALGLHVYGPLSLECVPSSQLPHPQLLPILKRSRSGAPSSLSCHSICRAVVFFLGLL